jgi:curved DNA-binding protein CbpA
MKTPYDILGVPRSADDNAIRAALRKAAKKYHPDVNADDPNAEQHLKEAIAAYKLLMEPNRRAAYDRHLRIRRRKKARRFLATALASAGVVSGLTLALVIWLAKPQDASVAGPELSAAAVEPNPVANQRVTASEQDAPDGVAAHETENAGTHAIVADAGMGADGRDRRPDAGLDIRPSQSGGAGDGAGAIAVDAPLAAPAHDCEARTPTPSLDSAHCLKRGLLRLENADFDGAIADFDAAIEIEPGNALAYSHRASAWGGKGDRERALADFEQAFRIDSGNPAIFRDRGVFWRRNGAPDLALVDFDQAIRLGFSDARAYNERGLVWHEKGRYERAIADFTRAIRIDPTLAAAYINRVRALHDKSDLAGSAAEPEHADRIEATRSPGDPDPMRNAE